MKSATHRVRERESAKLTSISAEFAIKCQKDFPVTLIAYSMEMLNICHNLLHQVLTYYDEYLHLMQRAKMEVMWVLSIVAGESIRSIVAEWERIYIYKRTEE